MFLCWRSGVVSACGTDFCTFVIVVEKENLEEALKHEEKMRNGGGKSSFGMWKLPKT